MEMPAWKMFRDSQLATSSMSAFTTMRNRPNVISVSGSDSARVIGLSVAFTRASASAHMMGPA